MDSYSPMHCEYCIDQTACKPWISSWTFCYLGILEMNCFKTQNLKSTFSYYLRTKHK